MARLEYVETSLYANWIVKPSNMQKSIYLYTSGFPWLLETLEKPGIYIGSLNPGNSQEFCVKTLNPLEICERHKK